MFVTNRQFLVWLGNLFKEMWTIEEIYTIMEQQKISGLHYNILMLKMCIINSCSFSIDIGVTIYVYLYINHINWAHHILSNGV